jgi:hypothetical protein
MAIRNIRDKQQIYIVIVSKSIKTLIVCKDNKKDDIIQQLKYFLTKKRGNSIEVPLFLDKNII